MPHVTITLSDSTYDSFEAFAEAEYGGDRDRAASDLLGAWLARKR